ncbi:MAG: hypothetical protein LBE92_01215 [Chryseobacterium sp.]|jgi:hypothetical protein|uniref:hypothetical protein n=1 Tax=Chryseobacterium sp. TaxID=1871047 RepID=UPI002830551E|nr:hypothetical protein [Chryseobacterium sp.]MDR2234718.1 hypothetical protein [Chryseobacterium sp.]
MSIIGKIIRVNELPPVGERENNVIYQVAEPGSPIYTDYAIDQNGDLKTHAVTDGSIPLELADTHLSVTNPSFITEGITNQEKYNTDTREKLNQKLNQPSADGNVVDFPKIVGIDDNGNVAKLPAGDLGKNIANSSLTTIPGAGLTLGANWTLNTSGLYYSITGLNDGSNDPTFNTFLCQDASGRIRKTNGKNALLQLPNVLTSAEKEQFGQAWNNQYSNGALNVYSLTPSVIKREHTVKYFVLQGLNLNLNPANTSVKFIPQENQLGIGEIDCLGFQTFADGKSMVVTIYGDALLAGQNYNMVIRTSTPVVQVHRTASFVTVSASSNNFDLSSIVWTKKIYNNIANDGVFGNAGAGQYQSNPNVKPYANEATVVSALKSSKIIGANQDFYLSFDVSVNFTSPGSTTPYHSIGLMLSSTPLDLLNLNIASLRVVGRADSWTRQVYLDNSSMVHSQAPINPETFNYIIMRRGSVVYFVLTKNGSVLTYSKSISTDALSFAMFNTNMGVSANISFNITELILF